MKRARTRARSGRGQRPTCLNWVGCPKAAAGDRMPGLRRGRLTRDAAGAPAGG